MARPRKDQGDKATHTMLPQRVLNMVDAAVRKEIFENPELLAERFPDWLEKGVSSRQIAGLRREFITRMIENRLSDAVRHPTRIRIVAPVVGEQADAHEALDWIRDEEAHLNREPPAAIREALALNRLKRDGTEAE